MGAPRDWAGFSRMVMVVSVSFRGVSDSYSGIMGAESRDSPKIKPSPNDDTTKLWSSKKCRAQKHLLFQSGF